MATKTKFGYFVINQTKPIIMEAILNKSILRAILLGLLTFNFSGAMAQSWSWAKSGSGVGLSHVISVSTAPSGDVYIAGNYMSGTMQFGSTVLPAVGIIDIFLAKYNSAGVLQWAKTLSTAGGEWVYSITTDASGNIYVLGTTDADTIDFGSGVKVANVFGGPPGSGGVSNYFIAKFDASGNPLLGIQGARDGSTNGVDPSALEMDAGGNIYVAGAFGTLTHVQFGPANTDTLEDYQYNNTFVAKYNSSGIFQFVKRIFAYGVGQSSPGLDGTDALDIDASGNIYTAGCFYAGTTNGTDIYVEKKSSSGSLIWRKEFGSSSTELISDVDVDDQGNVYFVGEFKGSGLTFGSTTLNRAVVASNNRTRFLVKLDASGNVAFAKRGTNGDLSYFNSVIADNAGNVYAAGGMIDTTFFSVATSFADAIIYRYDANGNLLGTSRAGDGQLVGAIDMFYDIALSGNSLIAAGGFASSPCKFDAISLTNSSGVENPFVAKLSLSSSTGLKKTDISPIHIYPNPATHTAMGYTADKFVGGRLLLSDALGRVIQTISVSENEMSVSVEELPVGVYFIAIEKDGVLYYSGKLVKE